MQLKSKVTDMFGEKLKGGVLLQVVAAIVGKNKECCFCCYWNSKMYTLNV